MLGSNPHPKHIIIHRVKMHGTYPLREYPHGGDFLFMFNQLFLL